MKYNFRYRSDKVIPTLHKKYHQHVLSALGVAFGRILMQNPRGFQGGNSVKVITNTDKHERQISAQIRRCEYKALLHKHPLEGGKKAKRHPFTNPFSNNGYHHTKRAGV